MSTRHKKDNNCAGLNIKRLRKALNFTQHQLAVRSKLSQGYINQLETGKKWLSQDTLDRVAGALGVPIAAVFEEENVNPSVKIVTSIDKRQLRKERLTQYVILKPEVFERKRRKKKVTKDGLWELYNKLPEDISSHYVRLMKVEAGIFKKKL